MSDKVLRGLTDLKNIKPTNAKNGRLPRRYPLLAVFMPVGLNYTYDDLGQMVGQQKANGQRFYVNYTASGKVAAIYADAAKTQLRVSFVYDESDMRILKTDHIQNISTYYIYDATGNVLAIYDNNGTGLQQKEIPIYADDRIGVFNRLSNNYQYELTDHLGNVRVVVNRSKNGNGQADVAYYSDYYPFGSPLTLANNDYRYGYQGQYAEVDKETGWNNFDFRMYDAQIGRWMSTDPMGEFWSPYTGMGNNPISTVDPDGGCTDCPKPKEPTYKGNGGKALNEVTITAPKLNGYGRMKMRNDLGIDPLKFMNGKPDYEAMNTASTYAAMKKPEDLQEYLIDAVMIVDGAEIGYLLVKFVGRGSITLAGKYMLKQAIKNPVNTERELEVLATTTRAGVKALMKGKGIDRAFREIADKNVIIKLAQKLKILKVNSLTKGADMEGLNLLGEYWWDVTTMKDWTKHTVKYGRGGKGLFY